MTGDRLSEFCIDPRFGRVAFGDDPAGYHATRPGYPDWVFETLRVQCHLAPGTATIEIGAGTGKATRRLLDFGADPLLAIEPDARLAAFIRTSIQDTALSVKVSTFEDATLERASFDLGVCATAFHWLDEDMALTKVADLLRPGGWWAMVWNVFGDDSRRDAFHDATTVLLNGPSRRPAGLRDIPFSLDTEARVAAMERTGAFDDIAYQASAWTLVLDAEQTLALYASFSNITIRPDREAILAELGRIARDVFHGRVTRNMITCLYTARRR